MRILILCTGNSARSQMAQALLESFDARLEVCSAGTQPAACVHPAAVLAMAELGIDIANRRPQNVERFLRDDFDYVITVCDHANETCPAFVRSGGCRLHMGFADPAAVTGTPDEVLEAFRQARQEIEACFRRFYRDTLAPQFAG